MSTAAIFGLAGQKLTKEEISFFKEVSPWGFILFARNVDTPAQIKELTGHLRDTLGWDCPILIDQEGGRVARLSAPDFTEWMAPLDQMATVSTDQARQAMSLRYRIIAEELFDVGIDVNCAPMLDLPQAHTHPIITNRCYGFDVDTVAEIGRAVAEGLLSGGVLPIIKHIPGHGRGSVDSHEELPTVSEKIETLSMHDFEPFRRLSDLPMAMTAHIVYPAIDADSPATTSKKCIDYIRNDFGFDGLLMTDDLSMKALGGDFKSRTKDSLAAGCDIILHCNGDMTEMKAIALAADTLTPDVAKRAENALKFRKKPEPFDKDAALQRLAELQAIS